MRTPRKILSDRRKNSSKRVVARAVGFVEGLESRVLLTGTMADQTSLFVTPSTYTSGDPSGVTLTANVVATGSGVFQIPTGTVTFFYNTTQLAQGTLSGGAVSITGPLNLPAGSDSIIADYSGDADFAAGSSTPQIIVVNGSGTTLANSNTTLTLNNASAPSGQSVTFTANVAPASSGSTPTGTVTFYDGSSVLTSSASIDPSGNASFTTSTLSIGTHSISALYGGDSTYNGSQSTVQTETITSSGTMSTTVGVTSSANNINGGSPVTFTATISPSGATGTVQFFDGSTPLGGSQPVSSGIASLTTTALTTAGSHNITATYSGDGTFSTNTSPVFVETVAAAALTSTTTTVTSSSPNITAGDTVTFTATLTPGGISSGTVQFFADGATLGSPQPVNGSVATLTTSALTSPGSPSITAVYSGDGSTFSGSTSAPITETVTAGVATTTTTLTAMPTSYAVGDVVTLTANVSPTTATGTVTFFDGMNSIGSAPLVSGTATFTTTGLGLGSHDLTAMYGGDANDAPSTSTIVNVNGVQGTAVLTASSSAPVINFGDSVTFTATVAPSNAGGVVPTGTVDFFDGTADISGMVTLNNGVATFVATGLSVGVHPITFTYSGDANYAVGTSPEFDQVVALGPTVTTLVATPSTIVYGNSTQLTATISPNVASGTVTFFDGSTPLGMANIINGSAVFTAAGLTAGTHSLTAIYNGDSNYAISTSAAVIETVTQAATTTTLTSAPNPVVFGNPITLTANVPIPVATGTVSFYAGSTLLGVSQLNNGFATFLLNTMPVGNNSLSAVYSGDNTYQGSTSPAIVQVVTQGLTSTSLVANPTTAAMGAPITFTVSVLPTAGNVPTPTGSVTLSGADGTVLASGLTLINGSATFTTTSLPLGVTTVVATYGGDPTYLSSVSATTQVMISVVTIGTTTTTLTTSLSNPTYGDSVTFTASVASVLANELLPTGTVTFYDGTIQLGASVAVVNGVAAFTTTSLLPGTDYVTAVYSGDTNFNTSTSAPVTEVVSGTANGGVYVTTLAVSSFAAAFGKPVTLTASVFPSLAGVPAPFGGTVTFFSGTQTLGAATLGADGTASLSTPLPAGSNVLTASYNGGGPVTSSLPRMVAISSPATPSLDKAKLPPSIIEGSAVTTNLPIVVTNLGSAKLKGEFTLDVFVDSSATLDSNKIQLYSKSSNLTLNAKKSKLFHAKETIPASLTSGTYYIITEVIDPNGMTNFVASAPIVVAQPYVSLAATVSPTSPPNIGIGKSAKLFVTITNTGNEAVSGLLNMTLTPSSDGTTSISGKVLGTGSVDNTTILPGKSRKYRIVLDTTPLVSGSYFPYITILLDGVSTTAVGTTPFSVG